MNIDDTIGPYRILGKLGEGGMGEVYRARDTRLKREVAVKVLPDSFAGDPDRHLRFQREAEVLASLNHPNIAAIYGIEESPSGAGLILELVDGETLAERLARGALPIDDALAVARQIADALEAAHDKGIVHRDLKPANIKLMADGKVKVLDFGLAKIFDDPVVGVDLTQSPTIAVVRTGAHVIMGTAAYMSPEQARGRAVDKRTDIWAFGCVLYEMLTGRQLFAGETISDIIARILERDVNFDDLPPSTPTSIRVLLARCLQKSSALRLRDIADARLEIDDAAKDDRQTNRPELGRRRSRAAAIAWLLIAGVTIIAGVVAVALMRRPAPAALLRVELTPPDDQPFAAGPQLARPTLSPDGRYVAFLTAQDEGQEPRPRLWVRALDRVDAQLIPGTENASSLFWAPDSRSIAFFAKSKLVTVDLQGGKPREICDVGTSSPARASGTWNGAGTILFGVDGGRPIYRVPADGGVPPVAVTTVGSDGGATHLRPIFLPDGDHFLYHARDGIHVFSLRSGESARVLPQNVTAALYAPPGYLVYSRADGTLWVQGFDPSGLTLSGEAAQLPDVLTRGEGGNQFPPFSLSDTGTLAYRDLTNETLNRLVVVDRSGTQVQTVGDPAGYNNIRLSPDGSRLLAQVNGRGNGKPPAIMLFDLRSNSFTQFAARAYPMWSRDGQRMAFVSGVEQGSPGVYLADANGEPEAAPVVKLNGWSHIDDWSPDGSFFTGSVTTGATNRDVVVVRRADRGASPTPLIATGANELQGKISPNGKWIAYTSDQSGQSELWVEELLKKGGAQRISRNGGGQPLWRSDGKELFFLTPERKLMAVSVADADAFKRSDPVALFDRPVDGGNFSGIGSSGQYAVSPDGKRFYLNTLGDAPHESPIQLIFNWPELLRRK